jgi:hypothetical protein
MKHSVWHRMWLSFILAFMGCRLEAQEMFIVTDSASFTHFVRFEHYDPWDYARPLHLIITLDLKSFYKAKLKEEYVPAILSYYTDDSVKIESSVRLKPRGEFRRTFCDFPPVRISFKSFEDTANASIPSLKMVTHCKYAHLFEQYLLKEYLVYRMYNLISDYSYKVRLLKVDYVDALGKKKSFSRYAFLIESDGQMEDEYRVKLIEKNIFRMIQTDYYTVNRMAIFQYMIGNTDWQLTMGHNIKLAFFDDSLHRRPVPIPYDFDYSGMVNASYAVPSDVLSIKTVRERLYLGPCIEEEEFYKFFDYYMEIREDLYRMVNDFDLLDKFQRVEMITYLDEFYEIIGNRSSAKYHIIHQCRKP